MFTAPNLLPIRIAIAIFGRKRNGKEEGIPERRF